MGKKKGSGLFFQMLIIGSKKTPTLVVPVYGRISFHICILGVFGVCSRIFLR